MFKYIPDIINYIIFPSLIKLVGKDRMSLVSDSKHQQVLSRFPLHFPFVSHHSCVIPPLPSRGSCCFLLRFTLFCQQVLLFRELVVPLTQDKMKMEVVIHANLQQSDGKLSFFYIPLTKQTLYCPSKMTEEHVCANFSSSSLILYHSLVLELYHKTACSFCKG